MPKFQITNIHSGADYGIWEGEDAAEALAALHRDAGYAEVRAEDGELIFPDEDTARLCGDLGEAWAVEPAVTKLPTPTNLWDLLEAIMTYQASGKEDELGHREPDTSILWDGAPIHLGDLDMTSLPVFGGEEPADTSGVWSWDEDSLLVGEGSELEIVPRAR